MISPVSNLSMASRETNCWTEMLGSGATLVRPASLLDLLLYHDLWHHFRERLTRGVCASQLNREESSP